MVHFKMFVNTEGVTYVHLKVVNTKGVTFRSVHKPIETTTEQIKGFVTPADHPSAVGSGAHSLLRSATPLAPPPQSKDFFERLAIDLGLSVSMSAYSPSMSVSLCRFLFISVCLQRSWYVGVHVGLFSVDLCRFRSLCRSVSI